ncbi:MAG TPA: dynamin family protein [Anaerolineae bacterium]|nr:dynamin family protein [Anaerolineae bacterium]
MPLILTDAQADLLRQEKKYLTDLYATLSELKRQPADLDALQDAIVRLEELFLIVVVGEFNAGKSALINALLGTKVLEEGAIPTTTRVTLVRYGDAVSQSVSPEDIAQVTYPLELLKEINIVDTPGTNAVIRKHEELTRDFIPRSDLVLFVTSADRPFTESERQFIEHIREWGKKIVLVINKRDLLEDEKSTQEVKRFVASNATSILGVTPELFFVSAKREYVDGKLSGGMEELNQYIRSWLDQSARLKVKFSTPLGVAEQMLKRSEANLKQEQDQLAQDIETAEHVEHEVESYEKEIRGELEPRIAEVDNLLYRLEARGVDFFDQNIRLTKITDLARGDKFRAMFEQQVLTGVPQEIDNRTRAVVDWLVEKDLREWQNVLTYLQRRKISSDELVGQVTTTFDMRRQALLTAATEAAQNVVASYDAEKESREIGAHVENAVAQTALAEAGAVGLGTLVTVAVTSAAFDVTGILLAGVIAVLGLFIIPYKRQQAKDRFKEKIQDLRTRLGNVLRAQFNAEADRTITRIKEGVAPYVRYIRGEKERLVATDAKLVNARNGLQSLQERVERLFA